MTENATFVMRKERLVKKWVLLLILVAVALGGVVYSQGLPKRSTVMGEVIDIAGYTMKGAMGEEHAEAGQFRAENGFPVGILEDESGAVYVALYRNPAPASSLETANKILAPLMGKKVVAQGRVYKKEGIQSIEIAVVSEM